MRYSIEYNYEGFNDEQVVEAHGLLSAIEKFNRDTDLPISCITVITVIKE